MKPAFSPGDKERRRQAEERVRAHPPETVAGRTEVDTQRLIHELQVHQVELEMQNEELQRARDMVEMGLNKYSDLFDFAPVGYLTLDRQGTILEANLAAARLLGVDRSRLVKRRLGLSVLRTDIPGFTTFLARVFGSKDRQSVEFTLLKEGDARVEIRVEATLAASGKECRAALMDITGQRQAELDRLVLSKLESTGVLAGGIAHDFNNLLSVILLDLELAQGLSPRDGELPHLLENARSTVGMARGLTQQLITFAHGGAPIRKPVRLSSLIQESIRPALSGSRAACDYSADDGLWWVDGDEGQLGQVIRNMILNAREAMPHGGTVRVRAGNATLGLEEKRSLPAGDYVRVSITDQGEGIARAVLPRIFDPYFTTKQRGDKRGMGLGLTICHTIVQKHGGAITVQSEPGKGTSFEIFLPARRESPADPQPSETTFEVRPGRILLMDDEEAVRTVVGATLRRLGHDVEPVADGRGAVEAYQQAIARGQPFDLVLLDLTVRAGTGGKEAIELLLKLDPDVKAIVMSGYANDPVLLEPERYGFRDVLVKPFDTASLRKALARALDRAEDH